MTVYLNVGGTYFETTENTLLNCDYFNCIKRVNGEINGTREIPYFIDRDPKIFKHILRLLRNLNYE